MASWQPKNSFPKFLSIKLAETVVKLSERLLYYWSMLRIFSESFVTIGEFICNVATQNSNISLASTWENSYGSHLMASNQRKRTCTGYMQAGRGIKHMGTKVVFVEDYRAISVKKMVKFLKSNEKRSHTLLKELFFKRKKITQFYEMVMFSSVICSVIS